MKLILNILFLTLLCGSRVGRYHGSLAFSPKLTVNKRACCETRAVLPLAQHPSCRVVHGLQSFLSSKNGNEEERDEFSTDLVQQVELVNRVEFAEFAGIAIWLTALSTFILMNEFVGPWPQNLMKAVPGNIWLLCHYLGGTSWRRVFCLRFSASVSLIVPFWNLSRNAALLWLLCLYHGHPKITVEKQLCQKNEKYVKIIVHSLLFTQYR